MRGRSDRVRERDRSADKFCSVTMMSGSFFLLDSLQVRAMLTLLRMLFITRYEQQNVIISIAYTQQQQQKHDTNAAKPISALEA